MKTPRPIVCPLTCERILPVSSTQSDPMLDKEWLEEENRRL